MGSPYRASICISMSEERYVYVRRVELAEAYRALLLFKTIHRAGRIYLKRAPDYDDCFSYHDGGWLTVTESPIIVNGYTVHRYTLYYSPEPEEKIKVVNCCDTLESPMDIEKLHSGYAFLGERNGVPHGFVVLPSCLSQCLLNGLNIDVGGLDFKEGLVGTVLSVGQDTLYTVLTEEQYRLMEMWVQAYSEIINYESGPRDLERWRRAAAKFLDVASIVGIRIELEDVAVPVPTQSRLDVTRYGYVALNSIRILLRTGELIALRPKIYPLDPLETQVIKITPESYDGLFRCLGCGDDDP